MIFPVTVLPAGISTVTGSPTIASLCFVASRSTVTTSWVEVVCRIAEALPPPLPEPAPDEPESPPEDPGPLPELPEEPPPLDAPPWPVAGDEAFSAFSCAISAFSCAISAFNSAISAANVRELPECLERDLRFVPPDPGVVFGVRVGGVALVVHGVVVVVGCTVGGLDDDVAVVVVVVVVVGHAVAVAVAVVAAELSLRDAVLRSRLTNSASLALAGALGSDDEVAALELPPLPFEPSVASTVATS